MTTWLWMLWAATASAAQMDLPMAELWAHAEVVVQARVSRIDPYWDEQGGIRSEVCLSEVVALQGTAPALPCVQLLSGQIGENVTVAEDEPALAVDRVYLMLLVRDESGQWRFLGGERGATVVRSARSPRAPTLHDRLQAWGVAGGGR